MNGSLSANEDRGEDVRFLSRARSFKCFDQLWAIGSTLTKSIAIVGQNFVSAVDHFFSGRLLW